MSILNNAKKFYQYKNSINKLLSNISQNQINQSIKLIEKTIMQNGRLYIVGNGGSASIASHISVDFAKIAKIKSSTFNNSNLITCFANDYGYENWLSKAINFYADPDDHLILISSSGRSKNIINAAKEGKKKNLHLTTLTGFSKNSELSRLSNISLWVNSKAYNIIENTHQIWLLIVCDMLVGKTVYSSS